MFPSENRLRSRYAFWRTRRSGAMASCDTMKVYLLEVSQDVPTQVGIVVSKKLSKIAPVRNKLKRRIREVVRTNLSKFPYGFWVVIYPTRSALDAPYEKLNSDFSKILQTLLVS